MNPSAEEIATVEALVEEIVAELKRNEAARLAQYRRLTNQPWRTMTREQLAEAYRRAGVKGPVVP